MNLVRNRCAAGIAAARRGIGRPLARGAQADRSHRAGRRHRRLLPRAGQGGDAVPQRADRHHQRPRRRRHDRRRADGARAARRADARRACGSGPVTVSPNTMKVPYTPNDYIPVIQLISAPYVFCVHPDFPATDGQELHRRATQEPGQVHLRQRRRRRPGPARHRAHPARDRSVRRATFRSRARAKR